jgi:hypothetical protein
MAQKKKHCSRRVRNQRRICLGRLWRYFKAVYNPILLRSSVGSVRTKVGQNGEAILTAYQTKGHSFHRQRAKTLFAVSANSSDKPKSDDFLYGAQQKLTHWAQTSTTIPLINKITCFVHTLEVR